jgi:hypothetical protein
MDAKVGDEQEATAGVEASRLWIVRENVRLMDAVRALHLKARTLEDVCLSRRFLVRDL